MKRITIGRAGDNDLMFNNPMVSGHHAEILVDSDSKSIKLIEHSTNGTMVNGRLVKNESVLLRLGDKILLPGSIHLEWEPLVYKEIGSRGTIPIDSGHNGTFRFEKATSTIHHFDDNQHSKELEPTKMVSMGKAISNFFSKYATFSGRSRRSEYWWFQLFNLIVYIGLSFLSVIIPFLIFIWYLATLVPGLALTVRRLHDTGRSGWFILMALIPLVGGIIMLCFCCEDSDKEANRFGESPKYVYK